MVNLGCTQWKHYTPSYLEIDYYCHYCYLYNFYKSPFKLSDWNPRHPIQRLQRVTHRTGLKLVLGWIFARYSLVSSRNFTEVRGWSAHLQSLAESLETDLGTIIKLMSINILIQNNCSFSISSMSCDPVTPIQQQIVLVNWRNETQLFFYWF